MKRKLCVLAVLVGICVFASADRSVSASWPLCNSGTCAGHPNNVCTCPAGTVRAGQPAPCDTWNPDCRAL